MPAIIRRMPWPSTIGNAALAGSYMPGSVGSRITSQVSNIAVTSGTKPKRTSRSATGRA